MVSPDFPSDFNQCDFAFTFDEHSQDGKNYRLPLYVHYPHAYGWGDLSCITNRNSNSSEADRIRLQKTKFCNMVVSNSKRDRKCEEFFYKLSQYKKVDSGGRYLNNIGGPVPDKLDFIKDYKFTMSFENSSYPRIHNREDNRTDVCEEHACLLGESEHCN